METKNQIKSSTNRLTSSALSSSSSSANPMKKSTPSTNNDLNILEDERSPKFVPRSLSFENVLDENQDNYCTSSSKSKSKLKPKTTASTSSSFSSLKSKTQSLSSSLSSSSSSLSSPKRKTVKSKKTRMRTTAQKSQMGSTTSTSTSMKSPSTASNSSFPSPNNIISSTMVKTPSPSTMNGSGSNRRSSAINSNNRNKLLSSTKSNKSSSSTTISSSSSSLEKSSNNGVASGGIVSRRRKQSKTPDSSITTPLTIRKQTKRGRGSTGSIQLHYSSTSKPSKGNDDFIEKHGTSRSSSSSPFENNSDNGHRVNTTHVLEASEMNGNNMNRNDNLEDLERDEEEEDQKDGFDLAILDSILEQGSKSSSRLSPNGVNSLSSSASSSSASNNEKQNNHNNMIHNESMEDNLLSSCSEGESESEYKSTNIQQHNDSRSRMEAFEKEFGLYRGNNDDVDHDDSILTQDVEFLQANKRDSRVINGNITHDFSTLLSDHDDDDDDDDDEEGDGELVNMSLTDLMRKLHVDKSFNRDNNSRKYNLDHLTVQSPTTSTYDQTSSDKSSTTSSPKRTSASASVSSSSRRRRRQKNRVVETPSSFSDGELNDFFVSTKHLEDVLSKGGEDALEEVLRTLGESLSDPEGFGNDDCKQECKNASNFLNNSMAIGNNKSLDEKYLRAHLKSALIALQSVKAERKDIEMNVDTLKNDLDVCRDYYQNQLNEKEVQIENIQMELKAIKEDKTKVDVTFSQNEILQCELDDTKGRLLLAELDLDSKAETIQDLESKLKEAGDKDEEIRELRQKLTEASNKLDVSDLRFQLKEEENEKNLNLIQLLEHNLRQAKSALSEKEVETEKQKVLFESKDEELRRLQSLYEEIENRESCSEKMQHEIETLKSMNSEQSKEVTEYKVKVDALQTDIEQANDTIDEQAAKIERLNEELQSTVPQKDMDQIQSTLQNTTNCLATKEEELKESLQNISTLKADLLGANEKIQTQHTAISALEKNLESASSVYNQVQRLETDLHEVNQETEKHLSTIDALRNDLEIASKKNEEVPQLERKLKDAEKNLAVKEDELMTASQRVIDLEGELCAANEEIQSQHTTIDTLKQDLQNISKAQDQVQSLGKELGEANQEVQEHQNTIDALKQDLELAHNTNTSMQQLEEALHDEQTKTQNAQTELSNARDSIAQLENDIKQCSDTIDDLNTQLTSQLSTIHSQSEEIAALTSSMQESKDELSLKVSELEEARERVKVLEGELEEQHATIEDLNTELASTFSKDDVADLQAKVIMSEKASDEILRLNNELTNAKDEIRNYEDILDDLKAKMNNTDMKTSEVNGTERVIDNRPQFTDQGTQTTCDSDYENVQSYHEEIERLNAALKESRSEQESLQTQLQALLKVEELNNTTIEECENKDRLLQNDLEKANGIILDDITEINKLKLELDEALPQSELEVAKSELQEYINQLEMKEKDLHETSQKLRLKEVELVEIKGEVQVHQNTIDALKQDLELAHNTNTSMQQLEEALHDEQTKTQNAHTELSNARDSIAQLENDIKQCSDTIDDLNTQLTSQLSTIHSQSEEIAALTSSMQESKDELSLKVSELEEARERVKVLEGELEEQHATIEDLNTELTSFLSKEHNATAASSESILKGKLIEARKELSKYKSQLDETNNNLGNMQKDLAHVEDERASHVAMIDELNTELISQLSENKQCTEQLEIALQKLNDECEREVSSGTERQVILELVDEIARIKTAKEVLCENCLSLQPIKDLLGQESFTVFDSILSGETKTPDSPRQSSLSLSTATGSTSNEIDGAKRILQSLLDFVMKNLQPTLIGNLPVQGDLAIDDLVASLDLVIRTSCKKNTLVKDTEAHPDKVILTSPVSSHGDNFEKSQLLEKIGDDRGTEVDIGDDNGSFVAYLKQQLDQNSMLISSALDDLENHGHDEMKYDPIEDEDITMVDLNYVDHRKYEFLRRKCDMLEAERDDVLNDTFALIDISKREHEAEIEAITNRVRKEAALEIQKVRDEFKDRIEKTSSEL